MESRPTALGVEGGLGHGRMEAKGERIHGHGQQCGDCEARGGGYKGNKW